MTDQNRGAYTPQSEAPLAFDARSARGPGEQRLPITLLVSAGIFVLLVVALAFFFMKGMGEDPLRDAAVVGEPIEAIKAPPAEGANGAQTNGLQVYTDNGASPPAFTAGPEAPAARPTAPITATPLPPPAPAPVVVAAAPTAPVAAAPLPKIGEKAAAPVVATIPPVKQPAAPPLPAAPKTGSFLVQIGAFSSSALADKGYADTGAKMPGQMGGKSKRVETVQRDGGSLYRTSIAGFASRAEADAFCGALKAKGGNCLVRQ